MRDAKAMTKRTCADLLASLYPNGNLAEMTTETAVSQLRGKEEPVPQIPNRLSCSVLVLAVAPNL